MSMSTAAKKVVFFKEWLCVSAFQGIYIAVWLLLPQRPQSIHSLASLTSLIQKTLLDRKPMHQSSTSSLVFMVLILISWLTFFSFSIPWNRKQRIMKQKCVLDFFKQTACSASLYFFYYPPFGVSYALRKRRMETNPSASTVRVGLGSHCFYPRASVFLFER